MSEKELISNQIFRTLTCNFTIRRKENPLKFGPLCYEHTVYKNLLVSSIPIFEKCFSQRYRSLEYLFFKRVANFTTTSFYLNKNVRLPFFVKLSFQKQFPRSIPEKSYSWNISKNSQKIPVSESLFKKVARS